MPLTLVLGPANSARAGEVLGAYAASAQRGALLVVPTAADVEHYSRELADQGSVLGSVLTFSGLAAETARRAHYSARRLSPIQRERVLARALRGARLDVLSGTVDLPGFVSAAGHLVAELGRSLVTPQRFASAMRSWAGGDPRRAPYAADVATVYLSYVRELERLGRVDGELYAWRALDALRAAPGSWGSDPVFFYGFDDLHPLQRDAVETLAKVVGAEVTVSLTYEAGRVALAARAEVVEELRPLAERVVELPAVAEYYASQSRIALHHLERRLFEPQAAVDAAQRIDPSAAVGLLEAGGERAEAELVAAEVLAMMRAGVPGHELAIVYRAPAKVAPLLERVFGQYGIAIAIEHEVPFSHTTFGRGLLALARCALSEEDRARPEDLLDYLRSPGVLDRMEVADALEVAVRREGLRTATEARQRLQFRLAEIDALRSSTDPAAELARHGRRLLAAPSPRSAPVLDGAAELDARALASMLTALREVADVGETLSGPQLIELLTELCVPAGVSPAPGAVLVTEPLAIRARRFRAVFVCGLQEGEFPLPPAPEPFLSDEQRRELAACSGLRLRPSDEGLARERYLFYACLSRATERVVLSYRSSDEEGNLALASPFIADVSELLVSDWPDRRRRRLLADVVWRADEAPTARELARSRADSGVQEAGQMPAGLGSLSQLALRRVRHREILSGGALEAYADCPVKWLVERELRPASLDPDPEPLARGSYVHSALEEVLRRLHGAVTPESLPEALSILQAVLSDLPSRISPGRPEGVQRAALRTIEADLQRYLVHEAADDCDWRPMALELRFGFEDDQISLPALELGEGAQKVRLRGAIDRVDVERDGSRAIVRDYKSGSVRPEYQVARWASDRRLQVALYMLAVRELLGHEPVAGLYQPVGGSDLRARGVFVNGAGVGSCLVSTDGRDDHELRADLEQAAARAITLAARLRAGELQPCPQTCSRDGCMYPGICRTQ